jgi:VanZ family protein
MSGNCCPASPRHATPSGMIPVRLRRLLFWAAATFAFVMAVLPHPPELPGAPSDKIQHVAAFATLGLLAAWAYMRSPLLRLLAGLSLFGALIEIVQTIPVLHRDADVIDWIADTIACGLVLTGTAWLRRLKAARVESRLAGMADDG